jgi:F-type H+-transporting ATPase subunit c
MRKNINFKGEKMSKNLKPLIALIFLIILMSTPLLAQGSDISDNRTALFKWSLLIGGALIAIAVTVGAMSQSKSITSSCESISRNPASGDHIKFLLIFGLVLIETLVIYALLISIIILMVNWGNI